MSFFDEFFWNPYILTKPSKVKRNENIVPVLGNASDEDPDYQKMDGKHKIPFDINEKKKSS